MQIPSYCLSGPPPSPLPLRIKVKLHLLAFEKGLFLSIDILPSPSFQPYPKFSRSPQGTELRMYYLVISF